MRSIRNFSLATVALVVAASCSTRSAPRADPEGEGSAKTADGRKGVPQEAAERGTTSASSAAIPADVEWHETAQFRVPVPEGFRVSDADNLAAVGRRIGNQPDAILSKPPASSDHYQTMIAFLREDTAGTWSPGQPCSTLLAYVKLNANPQTEMRPSLTLPIGSACQFDVAPGGGDKRALQTMVYVGDKVWWAMLLYDGRDSKAMTEYNMVLEGFAASKR